MIFLDVSETFQCVCILLFYDGNTEKFLTSYSVAYWIRAVPVIKVSSLAFSNAF
jgi:hypothetical protein